ncbi:MAG: FecR domain-containing protein [Pseudomonadota bacterium]
MDTGKSIRDQALILVERANTTASAENLEPLQEFRNRSAQHTAEVKWAEQYILLLPNIPKPQISPAQQRRIRREANWARFWEPHNIGRITATMVMVGIIGWGTMQLNGAPELQPASQVANAPAALRYETSRSNREIELPDGSVAWLDWRSAISVTYQNSSRQVQLHKGRVAFQVVPDSARPFTVHAGTVNTLVTGTEFVVDARDAERIDVAVVEGEVNVSGKAGDATLRAKQRASFSDAAVELSSFDAAAGEWRTGKIVLRNMPLVEALTELASYSIYELDVDGLRGFAGEVSGTYFINRADDAVVSLIQTHRLRLQQQGRLLILHPPRLERPVF